MTDTTSPQPAPRPGEARVLDLVVADLQARAEDGHKKYGTYLHTWNGRNPLIDAYQEALDQCMYLRQAIEEYAAVARRQLVAAMSDMSEELYCAGWMSGIEYTLWSYVVGTPGPGLADQVEQLRKLAALAGGWWHWPRVVQRETFVPMDEWLEMYGRWLLGQNRR